MRFLDTLHIPVVTTLRDSQNYLRVAETGVGLHEMKQQLVREDTATWEPLVQWLDARRVTDTGGAQPLAGIATHG